MNNLTLVGAALVVVGVIVAAFGLAVHLGEQEGRTQVQPFVQYDLGDYPAELVPAPTGYAGAPHGAYDIGTGRGNTPIAHPSEPLPRP